MKRLLPLLTAALCACGAEQPREALPGVSLLEDFTMAETALDGTRWRLKAEKGLLDEKNGVITFTSPRITFFEEDRMTSEISSRTGSLKMNEKAAVLNDSVEAVSARDGMRLSTERLYYSSEKGKVWTEDPITVHKGKTVIKGRGFTANPDLSEIVIHRQETRMEGS